MVEIEINNMGPIEEFRYEMEEPGLHLLVGEQGSGKTTTLRTVELAANGETSIRPNKRDGSKQGTATIAGKTLKINKTTREEGELGVDGLGDLDLSSLHWPRFEKPAIRDKTRIATLCRLAGLKGSVEDFKAVIGEEEWNTLVGPKVTITDDVVELAGRVKRAIDQAALDVEKKRDIAESNALALTKQFEGVDLTLPHDEKALSEKFTAAVGEKQRLQGQATAAAESIAAIDAAKKSLAAIPVVNVEQIERDVMADVEAASAEHQAAIKATYEAQNTLKDLERQVVVAKANVQRASEAETKAQYEWTLMKQSAAEQIQTARQAMEQRRLHEEAIQRAVVTGPTADEVHSALEAVENANQAMLLGAKVRTAIGAKEEHDKHKANVKALSKQAEKLRESAQAALGVLGDAIAKIPNCPLKVVTNDDGDTRLVIESDRSQSEYFDELSDGERWKVIVPLCLGPDRLIVLPQAAFGEMAPSTAAMLDSMTADEIAYLLTARAEDVPLQGISYKEWSVAVSSGGWEKYVAATKSDPSQSKVSYRDWAKSKA